MNGNKAVLMRAGKQAPNGTNSSNNNNSRKLEGLMEHLKILQEQKFTGHIKINFTQGGIGRVEKFEEISRILEP